MNKIDSTIANIKSLFDQNYVVTVGVSGKDSFVVAHAALEALKQAKEENDNVSTLYIITTDTTLDNFAIHGFLRQVHAAARNYAEEYDLPVKTIFLKPALSSFPMVEYIGRGKLNRTPETTQGGRSCAVSWKIEPMVKKLREIKNMHQTDKVVSLSGSRSEESVIRAANIEKRGETINTIAVTDMGLTMAPIKDWTLNDVWSLIGQIEEGNIESFAELEARGIRRHYAAGNGGSCDIFQKDNKAISKSCGARFGCTICSLVKIDFSLGQQIETDEAQYGYMRPFINLRTFMNTTLFDMERSRSIVGRDIDKDGWLKINYNQYSMKFRQELMNIVLTIDAREAEAAEDLGIEPRFQLITEQVLVAIQYHWAREGGEMQMGEAIRMFNNVHVNGARYDINEADLVEYATSEEAIKAGRFLSGNKRFDQPRYLHLDTMIKSMTAGNGFKAQGLGVDDSYYPSKSGHTVVLNDGSRKKVVQVEEVNSFTVDEDKAAFFVNDTFADLLELGLSEADPTEILKLMLHNGIIQLRKGSMKRLDEEAKRAQAINAMNRSDNYFETLYLLSSVTASERESIQCEFDVITAKTETQLSFF